MTGKTSLSLLIQLFALYREQGRSQELEETTKNLVKRFPAIPGLRTALAFLYGEIGHESDARTQFEQVAAKNFTDMVRDQGLILIQAS